MMPAVPRRSNRISGSSLGIAGIPMTSHFHKIG